MKFVTPKELSELLSIPLGTLAYWRKAGVGPEWHKFEGRVRYDVAEVQRYINHSKRVPSVRAALEETNVCV